MLDSAATYAKGEFMKLFISYSHADKDFAFTLLNTLSTSGIDVFFDEKDIKI